MTAVLCPPLSLPPHAIFVHGKCENVVNAACGVGCGPGYRLVAGSSIRLCQEDGTWTGTEVVCEGWLNILKFLCKYVLL